MSSENIQDIYPLSPMQQGMLFHTIFNPEAGEYIEQLSCALNGHLNPSAFEQAWQEVVNRHSILRTAFVWEDLDEPLQVVHDYVSLKIKQQDWRNLSLTDQEMKLQDLLRSERQTNFELSDAPLIRLTLVQVADDRHQFIWTHHHVLIDGWSLPIILNEVFSFYEELNNGRQIHSEPTRPYRDYIAWLQQQDASKAEKFWCETLRDFTNPTSLVVEQSIKSLVGIEEYCKEQIHISHELSEALQSMAKQYQLTLNTLMQGAWALLLNRYNDEDDVVFGATVSGRPPDLFGAETMVGLFINTLPVRVKFPKDVSLLSWLRDLQKQQSELRQYEFCSLVQIQGWSGVPRHLPLFKSILVFENYPIAESTMDQKRDLDIQDVQSYSRTNYPITVVVSPGKQVGLEIVYDRSRFEPRVIVNMLSHLITLLENITKNLEQKLSNINLLTDSQQDEILHKRNNTDLDYKGEKYIHKLFEKQVESTPQATAIICESTEMTYQELNQKANQLAHHLTMRSVGSEVLVGIFVERSLEMMVGLLGILKAGGAYVPLDPLSPKERLAYMLEDSNVSIVLTQERLKSQLPMNGIQVICLDSDWGNIAIENIENPENIVKEENIAYVIYTSGSTGKPKGTLITHRGLTNYLNWCLNTYPLKDGQGSLVHSSLAFDATITGLFAPLAMGKSVTLIPDSSGIEALSNNLKKKKNYSIIKITPAHLELLGQQLRPDEAKERTKAFIIGGENLTNDHIAYWQKVAPDTLLINEYGPTETVVGCMNYQIPANYHGIGSIPIGHPISNTQIYILDSRYQPVPTDVPGELFIGGFGLARGYLNRPDLTAEKFIPDPFSTNPGARLYSTGDLARYLPDGNIEFLGRIDFQVKIRGFRIELGEIETVLSQHPGVREAVITAKQGGWAENDIRLIAYIVPAQERIPSIPQLRDFLEEKLPDYMIPTVFMQLDSLPLTANGKVDRKTLPEPDNERPDLGKLYEAPRTPTEELLAGIFKQVLVLKKVGIHDNFFELGGHSLLATQLLSRVRETFQTEIDLQEIFAAATIFEIGRKIDDRKMSEKGITASPLVPISRDQELPLSFAQQRLWFLDQLEPNSPFYNIPTSFRLTGILNIEALEQSINTIIQRHESLRTIFKEKDGKPYQDILAELTLPVDITDLATFPEDEKNDEVQRLALEEAQRPFNLGTGPLLRFTILKLNEQEHVILFTMHHIISDGWSVAILIHEVVLLYNSILNKETSSLPELPIQYADFAAWQHNWLQGEILENQLSYWREQLKGAPPLIELPLDHPRQAVQTFNGRTITKILPSTLSQALAELSQEEEVTLFMTLLAAFQTFLYRYTGQNDLSVGVPIANRNRIETENLIGFFINTLVMRIQFTEDANFRELLGQVRDIALGAYAHQDIPFEMLVEELKPERDLSHTPLFQVMLILQNTPVQRIELPQLTLSPIETESGIAKFDLSLEIKDGTEGMILSLEYNSDLFDASTIRRMLKHFHQLLEKIVADPDQSISKIDFMNVQEKQHILQKWNVSTADFPDAVCAHEWFESLARKHPRAIAASYEDQNLSYEELNRRANQLANYLKKLGVKKEDLIGICMDRSFEMVVGIMGTLKAGGAFVPLDPAYPSERLAYMIKDSSIAVLLTQQKIVEFLPTNQTQVLCLDSEFDKISSEKENNPTNRIVPENLAYVIYTSGSTGKPKGTMLQHRGLCNLAKAQQEAFDVGLGSRVLQFSSLSFDAAVWETVMALLSGGTLCLANREVLSSGQDLAKLMKKQKITTVTLPPSVAAVMPDEQFPDLQVIITAGEKCTSELVSRWSSNGRRFFNAYGPTETTVCASMLQVTEHYRQGPPIGRPINNFQLYVLDKYHNPVPIGVSGELHIGGVGLARGYLNKPDLTAEKFIPNPFSNTPGARLYKSGDLVRYLPDGNIEFLGRIDFQAKVRGFRIELGEIETILGEHTGIRDVIVLVREDTPGDSRLVAYIIPEQNVELKVSELKNYLRERLPDYMVPSAFINLEQFPLTPNGKVDRKALPAIDHSRPELENEYVAPRNDTETKIAAICTELLKIEKVGVYDNFFDLGGHSLLATQFISRMRSIFQVELPLRSLFEKPTIADLSEEIDLLKLSGAKLDVPTIQRRSREAHRVKFTTLEKNAVQVD